MDNDLEKELINTDEDLKKLYIVLLKEKYTLDIEQTKARTLEIKQRMQEQMEQQEKRENGLVREEF